MRCNLPRCNLAICALAALILTGCASIEPKGGRSASTAQPDAADTRMADVPDYLRWHQVPNPNNNLWLRLRNGYQLPLQYGHPAIREWINYYLTHDKHLYASIRRARPYLWHVVEAVSARGMPLELALLPIVESGYNASAVSSSGAGGLWQFMPPTASDMGLHQGWWFDARFDALSATDAALDYLSWLHDYFNGDWLLALAAYNAGPGRVGDAVARARARGEPADFWHLDLPTETTAYVPKLLALRRLLANPAHYGIDWPYLASRPQTIEVSLPAPIDMDIAADMLAMPETRLRELNPGVRHSATAPEHDAADLLVPIEKAESFRVALANAEPAQLVDRDWHRVQRGDTLIGIARRYGVSVGALRRANGLHGSRIYVGQRLALPGPGSQIQVPTQPYVVQSGDTLWAIAHRHGITVAALRRVNNLGGSIISPGQTLKLPMTAQPVTHRVQPGDTLWAIAQRYNTTVAQLRQWNRLHANTLQPGRILAVTGPAPLPDFYRVQDGDTLWSIAQRFEMKVPMLRHLNNLGADNTIRPGQRLLLQPAG